MKEKAYQFLEGLGIGYQKFEHPPLFTCEDVIKYGMDRNGLEVKNLFVRNQNKSAYYLVVIPSYKRADLRCLQEVLCSSSKFSFASCDDLEKMLGTYAGAVSLLNVVNVPGSKVTYVIDECVFKADTVGFHPSDNKETLVFETKHIGKILDECGAQWMKINIKGRE